MTSEFDTAAKAAATGGVGGPSFKFADIGDTVTGEVIGVTGMDVTVYGSNPPRVKEVAPGVPARQMVVTLKTDLRNWAQVAKQPKDQNGAPEPASNDEGNRNLYAQATGEGSKALFTAISRAIAEHGISTDERIGGRLQVKLTDLRDTGKGNPAKLFEARFAPGKPKSEFDAPAASAASAPAPTPAAAAADPWAVGPQSSNSTPPGAGFSQDPPF